MACSRGATDTGLVLRGEAEFPLAVLIAKLDVPDAQAVGAVRSLAQRQLGCDPGTVPTGHHDWTLPLCRACAETAGLQVGELGTEQVPGYAQPAGDESA